MPHLNGLERAHSPLWRIWEPIHGLTMGNLMCLILMKILTTKMQQGGLPTNIWIKEAKGRKSMHIAHMKNQSWKCPWKGKFGQLMCTNFFTKRETIWAQKSMAWWVTQPSWKWIRMVHIAHLKIKIQNVPRHGTKMGNLWVSFFPTNGKKNHSYLRMIVDDPPSPQRKIKDPWLYGTLTWGSSSWGW